jgi:hypothetical protein
MSLWVWFVILAALIKLPIAGLLLWLPYRYDESMRTPEAPDASDEEGGSKALPGGPLNPHPRTPLPRKPRRGPHGSPAPSSPPRLRSPRRSVQPLRSR